MLSVEALQARADRAWEAAGKGGKAPGPRVLQRITLHECRHTCATWLDGAGVRPVVVSQLMGHAAPAYQVGAARITQERYTHVLPGDLDDALSSFDEWLSAAAEEGNELSGQPRPGRQSRSGAT